MTSEISKSIASSGNKPLSERKRWFSPVAQAYDKVRPRYPREFVNRIVEVVALSSNSKVLEVGCGPGTATTEFARTGCSINCLEPNPDFYLLAQKNCRSFKKVRINNISFEEWPIVTAAYDVILSASAFHWIPAAVGFRKAADALHQDGYLALLWNKELQPSFNVYKAFSETYERHAPQLNCYENEETQENVIKEIGLWASKCGRFKEIKSERVRIEVIYTSKDYLMLLDSYSPYLSLDSFIKRGLFRELDDRIINELGGTITLSYLSAFYIFTKR